MDRLVSSAEHGHAISCNQPTVALHARVACQPTLETCSCTLYCAVRLSTPACHSPQATPPPACTLTSHATLQPSSLKPAPISPTRLSPPSTPRNSPDTTQLAHTARPHPARTHQTSCTHPPHSPLTTHAHPPSCLRPNPLSRPHTCTHSITHPTTPNTLIRPQHACTACPSLTLTRPPTISHFHLSAPLTPISLTPLQTPCRPFASLTRSLTPPPRTLLFALSMLAQHVHHSHSLARPLSHIFISQDSASLAPMSSSWSLTHTPPCRPSFMHGCARSSSGYSHTPLLLSGLLIHSQHTYTHTRIHAHAPLTR